MNTHTPSRREVLSALAAAMLGGPSCAAPTTEACAGTVVFGDLKAPLTIDVHAHVFNGSDLQIKEFLAQVVVGHQDSELYPLARAMGSLLQNLAWSSAPSASEEEVLLNRYQRDGLDCTGYESMQRAAAPAYQDGYLRGRRELQAAARSVAASPGGASVLGPRPALPGPGLGPAIASLPDSYAEYEQQLADSVTVLGSQPHLKGYLQFLIHNFNFRHVNALDYLSTYSRAATRKIDLLVPSLVDYDWWLARGSHPATRLEQQVEVMSRVSVFFGGRVHGFVPFCPFRETMTLDANGIGDSLRLVKKAVQTHGFIGVKLYPPMGFAAWGNSDVSVWKDKPTLPAAASKPGFGKRLDAAMKSLFDWCIANDVPVMAHSNRSNGPYDDFKTLADSSYWQRALEQFPGLKVSFGHFGDTDLEDHDGDRSAAFLKLITPGGTGQNVFADSGFFAGVLSNPNAMAVVLRSLYAQSDRRVLAERLMYGTDWTMILPEKRSEMYLDEFIAVMTRVEQADGAEKIRGGTLSDAFFGANAVQYLGLKSGQPARRRLEAFYDRNALGEPDWMRKLA